MRNKVSRQQDGSGKVDVDFFDDLFVGGIVDVLEVAHVLNAAVDPDCEL
jgi:hypothetical protein